MLIVFTVDLYLVTDFNWLEKRDWRANCSLLSYSFLIYIVCLMIYLCFTSEMMNVLRRALTWCWGLPIDQGNQPFMTRLGSFDLLMLYPLVSSPALLTMWFFQVFAWLPNWMKKKVNEKGISTQDCSIEGLFDS